MQVVITDGGREEAGYKGKAGDCVTRAIAIASELPYQEVYDGLFAHGNIYKESRRDKTARSLAKNGSSPRDGVYKKVSRDYLKKMGWNWTPTMFVGVGCTVHLKEGELPMGRLIVKCSKHLVAVIDGVVHDTFDCTRDGTRCVYGYWTKN